MKKIRITFLMLLCGSIAVAENAVPEKCTNMPVYSLLDFWVGEWVVYSGAEKVGENRIEKVLGGCAVMEHWQGASGAKGKSLFFVDSSGTWKQVWVTEWAASPGGVKEKTHLADLASKAIVFQGEIKHSDVGTYLDRTTLAPIQNGRVRQIIEISQDGGETWKTIFDAIYKRMTVN